MGFAAPARVALCLALGVVLFVIPACRRKQPQQASAPSASARAQAVSSAPPPPVAPPLPRQGCRVLGVKGKAPPAGTPGIGTLFQGHDWLDLGAGAELQLKHTETTREFSLLGPGRFLACVDGAEAVLVAEGVVVTTPGPGSRAGAEVQLATPFGIVHYADAALRLDVQAQKLELDVTLGAAQLSATVSEDRPGGTPPAPVHAPRGRLSLAGKVEPEALAKRCALAAAQIQSKVATSLPSAGPDRGAWAVSLFEARKAARYACARAHAAAGRLEGAERVRLEDQLGRQEGGVLGRRPGKAPEPESDAGR